ncbi:uncharacterized protein CANTADRAFT_24393 [Suhomyces tanzawaensis NRRL Y-17324]|uniref:Uncharacterized protein n=1 Tax=Suhomyces tanzawaensis NRRL Y-17324 TaxID=984487 RepID=A0A1E4SPJ5_9ASCO|nr:uncharacterized protein CANTADRAFT_24393 [Suhomyces tanzawaensis NRRL Y-17324]ODV81450.1 hypothetical protein CANTADRAFT_24393 [Suhomyces tanzawaensis NRRL Y-17324]
MSTRKSSRTRTMTSKVRESFDCLEPTNKPIVRKSDSEVVPSKRRRIQAPEEVNSDKIDPVEKLLSLTNVNNDILNLDEEETNASVNNEQLQSSNPISFTELKSLNFTKILNDNIRSYYANFRKTPLEVYNDHSSFALLNSSSRKPTNHDIVPNPPSPSTPTFTHNPNVPFFKNVNFNSNSKSNGESYTFDDYFSYGEEEKVPSVPAAPSTSDGFSKVNNKMRFHYRQNHNNLNLSDFTSCSSSALNASSYSVADGDSHDIFKILNKRSILSGKASEMVSTGTFLINDFFL